MIYIQQKFVSNYQALLASTLYHCNDENKYIKWEKIDFKDFPSTLMNF